MRRNLRRQSRRMRCPTRIPSGCHQPKRLYTWTRSAWPAMQSARPLRLEALHSQLLGSVDVDKTAIAFIIRERYESAVLLTELSPIPVFRGVAKSEQTQGG